MFVQSIIYTFAPEDVDRVKAILYELRGLSRAEPGVVRFDVVQSVEQAHVFALWEVYVDEAALHAHFETEHFKRLGAGGIRALAKERIATKAVPLGE